MIRYIYSKAFSVLMKKPLKLWGLSLLIIVLCTFADAGFAGVLAAAWVINWLLTASMDMIYLNSYRTGLEPKTSYLFSAFSKDRFVRVASGMAWRALWIFLWALIPIVGPILAIVRTYQYRFVPYILMTREDVKPSEATDVSKQLSMGYKSKMFWADVLPGILLGVAAGILGLLSSINYVGFLFGIVLILLVVAYLVLINLFRGIVRAAFYAEIEQGTLQANAAPEPAAPEAPVYAAPEAPVYAAPVYEAPAAPVYQAPAAPVYEAPAAPVYEAPAAPVYEAPAAPVQNVCPNCGAVLADGMRFCTACGTRIDG